MASIASLGVAVAGLGVGEQHARRIAALPQAQLLRVYDPSSDKAGTLAAELGAVSVDSFDELLSDAAVGLVIVASPDDFHARQIAAALESGRHVFAEKPLCKTAQELDGIVKLWRSRSSRQQLRSNLILRAAPLYQRLKEQIDAGALGRIYTFDGDYLYGRLPKIIDGWRGASSYSAMTGGGVHLIDLMCWLTGERPSAVVTMGNNICTSHSAVDVSDFMASMYRFRSGMVGRITANLGCVHRHHHVLRVFGTKATFIYDDAGARIHQTSDPLAVAAPIEWDPLPQRKSDLLPDFVANILSNRESSRQTEADFAVMRVCMASDLSLSSRREEAIEYA